MADIQPPPTYALPILVDEKTKLAQFSPIWLKWFLDLAAILNTLGGVAAGEHNSLSGLQGGAANEYYHTTQAQNTIIATLAHGRYTPTLTNVTNLTASTAYQGQYLRLGNVVFAAGLVDIDPTIAGACELGISLPVASNIGAVADCAGAAAASGIAGQSAAITGDAANNRAAMKWIAVDITNQPMYYSFGYEVI